VTIAADTMKPISFATGLRKGVSENRY
jgi:hypothetical protein